MLIQVDEIKHPYLRILPVGHFGREGGSHEILQIGAFDLLQFKRSIGGNTTRRYAAALPHFRSLCRRPWMTSPLASTSGTSAASIPSPPPLALPLPLQVLRLKVSIFLPFFFLSFASCDSLILISLRQKWLLGF